jgi:hypothetical protein
LTGTGGSPFTLSSSRQALELRNATGKEVAERLWRTKVKRLWGWCFFSQAVATAVGALGFAVDGERLGRALLSIGQAGVVFVPFAILVVWVVEAHRRGDL